MIGPLVTRVRRLDRLTFTLLPTIGLRPAALGADVVADSGASPAVDASDRIVLAPDDEALERSVCRNTAPSTPSNEHPIGSAQ